MRDAEPKSGEVHAFAAGHLRYGRHGGAVGGELGVGRAGAAAAQHQHGQVGRRRGGDRFGDAGQVVAGQGAAAGVAEFDAGRGESAQAVEHARSRAGALRGGVVAELVGAGGGVRAQDGDTGGRGAYGQCAAVVVEEGDGGAGEGGAQLATVRWRQPA